MSHIWDTGIYFNDDQKLKIGTTTICQIHNATGQKRTAPNERYIQIEKSERIKRVFFYLKAL